MKEEKIMVCYCSGSTYDGKPTDYMTTEYPIPRELISEENADEEALFRFESDEYKIRNLYCEVCVDEDDIDEDGNEKVESDEAHYEELKEMVIEKAKSLGIDPSVLQFYLY